MIIHYSGFSCWYFIQTLSLPDEKWVWMCMGVLKHNIFAGFACLNENMWFFVDVLKSHFLDFCSFRVLPDEIVIVLHACILFAY